MNATRRLSIAALIVACTHLVFGAIVRISGSGMGCGNNWPKCYGYWFPPFSRPDLIVEVSHRYLASILTFTVLTMALVAFRNRRVAGIGGPGGVLRSALGAVAAVFAAAILGGVTVKMGNAPWATVAHWLVAMTLLAMVATTAIRAGALGGASSLIQRGSSRAKRSAFAAAVLAIFAVALGGLTAKFPGASVGCTTIPMCGPNPSVEPAGVHIQLTHRTIAVLLVLHLFGIVMMLRKRRATEAPVVIRAAYVALGMVLLQLVVASSMILFHLPPVLRSLHEATGVGIWLSCFVLAYLARRASRLGDGETAALGVPVSNSPPTAPSPISPASVTSASHAIIGATPAVAPLVATAVAESAVFRAREMEAPAVEATFVETIQNDKAGDVLFDSRAVGVDETQAELAPVVVQTLPAAAPIEELEPSSVSIAAAPEVEAHVEPTFAAEHIETTDAHRDEVRVADVSVVEPRIDDTITIDAAGIAPVVEPTFDDAQIADALDAELMDVIETVERESVETAAPAERVPVVEATLEATDIAPTLVAAELIDAPLIAGELDLSDGPIPVDGPQPVVAPAISPLPLRPKHTMAVIIARGADL
jgi:cytochrome c oxidase assembly protein subunit 15